MGALLNANAKHTVAMGNEKCKEVEAFKSSGLDVVKREEEVLELVEQHKMLVHLSELCITSARQESDAEKLKERFEKLQDEHDEALIELTATREKYTVERAKNEELQDRHGRHGLH